jgi:tetratricopeptide (TPR) repeat protein
MVHANRGVALNKLKRYLEAIESAETALKTNPDYELALFVKKQALSLLHSKN